MKTIDNFRTPEYRFLSNFGECPNGVLYEKVLFPTAEHAYQAAKTNDIVVRRSISKLDTPGKAKRAGKAVVLRSGWNEMRLNVMRKIIGIKFLRNPELLQKLIDTGDAKLIEGNTWGDTFWGVCNGKGENHLGKILMEFRDFLQNFSALLELPQHLKKSFGDTSPEAKAAEPYWIEEKF